jgi:hypothetical protein
VYVVTYNNPERINQNIDSFLRTTSQIKDAEFSYNIINNHSNFFLNDAYRNLPFIKVFHSLRPDNSCGHLARDYNFAYIDGFKNLLNPSCDQVICLHDDSMWMHGWYNALCDIHKTYTYYQGDYGCSMTSVLPEAVRKIGLWDERFCNIGYHEADYSLRALIYNKEKSTINDHLAGRVLNPTCVIFNRAPENMAKLQHGIETMKYHPVSRKVFHEKWGIHPEFWYTRVFGVTELPTVSKIKNYVFYPYFEKDVEDLEGKNYCVEWTFRNEWY